MYRINLPSLSHTQTVQHLDRNTDNQLEDGLILSFSLLIGTTLDDWNKNKGFLHKYIYK